MDKVGDSPGIGAGAIIPDCVHTACLSYAYRMPTLFEMRMSASLRLVLARWRALCGTAGELADSNVKRPDILRVVSNTCSRPINGKPQDLVWHEGR